MARITWDVIGSHLYETGVSQGVLYVESNGSYNTGVPWNGLIGVTEKIVPGDSHVVYGTEARKYEFYDEDTVEATIEAYTYPLEFNACDGFYEFGTGGIAAQQSRSKFALCFKTMLGNDTSGESYGYKIHILYGCTATPSEREYQTMNDSPELVTFSWDVTTTPTTLTNASDTSLIILDSTRVSTAALTMIENRLYGTASADPTLLSPSQIASMISSSS